MKYDRAICQGCGVEMKENRRMKCLACRKNERCSWHKSCSKIRTKDSTLCIQHKEMMRRRAACV